MNFIGRGLWKSKPWSGRVALVTGASSGIGAGIATALVKNGMIVIGVARDVDRIKVSVFF